MPPDVKFIREGCHMPSKCNPCTPNTEGKLDFINQGDAGDCMLIYQLKGENYLLWGGYLESGSRVVVDVTIHFSVEDYPESETVTITYFCGYKVAPNEMVPTDQLPFDVYIQVKRVDWLQIAVIGGIVIGSVAIGYVTLKPVLAKVGG